MKFSSGVNRLASRLKLELELTHRRLHSLENAKKKATVRRETKANDKARKSGEYVTISLALQPELHVCFN